MSETDMNELDWRSSVRDMLEFCHRILNYTAGFDFDLFVAEKKTYDATLRNIELLGVAVSYIPDEVREAHPEIPWGAIVGTRNRLAHTYSQIDDDIIWTVIQNGIPSLQVQLRALLADADEDND